jgi:hypothetical protein
MCPLASVGDRSIGVVGVRKESSVRTPEVVTVRRVQPTDEELRALTRAGGPRGPRAAMVGWYDPFQLASTGLAILSSTLFARNSDRRLLEAPPIVVRGRRRASPGGGHA